jgi:hypothetical protein
MGNVLGAPRTLTAAAALTFRARLLFADISARFCLTGFDRPLVAGPVREQQPDFSRRRRFRCNQ